MSAGRMRRAFTSSESQRRESHSSAPCGVAHLRMVYFAQAGDSATRYGISFERILQHLWRTRRTGPRLALRAVNHMDDLTHAVACVDDVGRAWSDLVEQNEAALVRMCRRQLDDAGAIVFVRRVFADLRLNRACPRDRNTPSIMNYRGTQPLRSWLVDRTLGRLGRIAASRASVVACRTSTLVLAGEYGQEGDWTPLCRGPISFGPTA